MFAVKTERSNCAITSNNLDVLTEVISLAVLSKFIADQGLLRTTFTGTVTDRDLIEHYQGIFSRDVYGPGRNELVDATRVEHWLVTSRGQWQLAAIAQLHQEKIEGMKVAMVATQAHVFAMFRMWEMQREHLNYEVRVFNSCADAEDWLAQVEDSSMLQCQQRDY